MSTTQRAVSEKAASEKAASGKAVSGRAVSEKAVSGSEASEPRQQVLNRLRRARGQLNAVIDMVEQERSCKEIITQLAAVSKALDRAGFKIISENIQECITRDGEPGADGVDLPGLEKLFLSLA